MSRYTQRPEMFSVYVHHAPPAWFGIQSYTERVREWVDAEEATKAAAHYTRCVAAQMEMIEWVRIVDEMDCCVFQWERGKGITHPLMEFQ